MKRLAIIAAVLLLAGCKPQIEFIQAEQRHKAQTETETITETIAETHTETESEVSEAEQTNNEQKTETANLSQNLTNECMSENMTREPDAAASYSQVIKVPETEALKNIEPQMEVHNQVSEYTPPITDEASEAVYAAPIEDEYSPNEATADSDRSGIGENWEYCGSYRVTAYMWTGYRMANGEWPDLGYCATGDEFPFGTVLYIDGYGYYTVGDRGVYNGQVDLYMHTYEACMQVGLQYLDVWVVR